MDERRYTLDDMMEFLKLTSLWSQAGPSWVFVTTLTSYEGNIPCLGDDEMKRLMDDAKVAKDALFEIESILNKARIRFQGQEDVTR